MHLAHAQQTSSCNVPDWQVGTGKIAYDKVVTAVCNWKHMDLGWTKVQAQPAAKGSLVCVLPHLVVPWMQLPLQVTFLGEGSCQKAPQKQWNGIIQTLQGTSQTD